MVRVITLLTMIVMLVGGQAWAATTTGTVPVTAVVNGSCTFDNTGAGIDFGSLDNSAASPAYSATVVQPTINCTNLMAYTITDDDGLNELVANQNRLSDGAASFIVYTSSYTAAKAGTGAADPMDIIADIAVGGATGATPGAYNDTITYTVTW